MAGATPTQTCKRCTVCDEEKPLDKFYRHSRSPDGRNPRCKACDNARKANWIKANPERHGQYVKRWRQRNPEAAAAIYKRARERRFERQPDFAVRNVERHRLRHPEKDRARRTVQRAVRDGRLHKPNACERCDELTEARELHGHHEDYSKPLEIEWLCRDCHQERHRV